MKNKPIIIVSGEPYRVFSEIFFKSESDKSEKIGTFRRCSTLLIAETTKTQGTDEMRKIN